MLMIIGASTRESGGHAQESRLRPGMATYSSRDKAPFGSYVPFKVMENFFQGTKPKTVTRSFSRTYANNSGLKGQNNAYIIVAERLWLTEADATAMAEYVGNGNKLLLAIE